MLEKGNNIMLSKGADKLANYSQQDWPPFSTPFWQYYAKSSAWETSSSRAIAICRSSKLHTTLDSMVLSYTIIFHASAVVRDRLFLDEKIDVVDSERSKLLIRTLESHEQSTKRNVRLAARY